MKKIIKKVILIILVIIVILAAGAGAFLYFWPSFGRAPSAGQQSAYAQRTEAFYDGVFHTPEAFQLLVDVEDRKGEAQAELKPQGEIPVNMLTEIPEADIETLSFTWFGHSTFMLQMHGMNIFVDPILSDFSSPVGFVGAKRMAKVPMTADALPEIDLILISHDHYDHLDYQTIKDIDHKVKNYCVPLGVENHLERWGVAPEKIHTMAWWEDVDINGLRISSTPGQHYSGRLPWNSNQTLWSGYFLQDDNHKIYYTGDTGYGEFFGEIRERYGAPDLMISEDGQYDPQWPDCYMSPREVLTAAGDMGADWLIPVHWAGFALSRHDWDNPAVQLTALASGTDMNVSTPRIGEIVDFNEIDDYQEAWWREVE